MLVKIEKIEFEFEARKNDYIDLFPMYVYSSCLKQRWNRSGFLKTGTGTGLSRSAIYSRIAFVS
jgi:hypothetical protein